VIEFRPGWSARASVANTPSFRPSISILSVCPVRTHRILSFLYSALDACSLSTTSFPPTPLTNGPRSPPKILPLSLSVYLHRHFQSTSGNQRERGNERSWDALHLNGRRLEDLLVLEVFEQRWGEFHVLVDKERFVRSAFVERGEREKEKDGLGIRALPVGRPRPR
jgi:hypothetical protein